MFVINQFKRKSLYAQNVLKRTRSTTYDQRTQLFTRINSVKATKLVSSLQITLTVKMSYHVCYCRLFEPWDVFHLKKKVSQTLIKFNF